MRKYVKNLEYLALSIRAGHIGGGGGEVGQSCTHMGYIEMCEYDCIMNRLEWRSQDYLLHVTGVEALYRTRSPDTDSNVFAVLQF
jgi:hypothetical protein